MSQANNQQAVFYPFEVGAVSFSDNADYLLVNGKAAQSFPQGCGVYIQQNYKYDARGAHMDFPDAGRVYDYVLIVGVPQKQYMRYLLAKSYSLLAENGWLICALGNDEGGRGLRKDIAALGLEALEESKFKARIVMAQKNDAFIQQDILQSWLNEGAEQEILGGAYISQPGVYGWDALDKGSALLAENIDYAALKGAGADFGCGYGYLSRQVIERAEKIRALDCFDADGRAVSLCRKNNEMLARHAGIDIYCGWEDVTHVDFVNKYQGQYDWVLMNPPFHQGKKADISIGQSFIRNAAQCLKDKGVLYMVANVHLPYENILRDSFKSFEVIIEADGFKVLKALR